MKILKDSNGIAHLAVLLIISAAAIGFVGWASYNAWQANKEDYSSNEVQTNESAPMHDKAMTDEHHIEALIKSEESCGTGEQLEIGSIVVYKGFAKAEVGCRPSGVGGTSIFKKIDNDWQRISATQNCLDPVLKSKYGMSEQIKEYLFHDHIYCTGP